MEYKLRRLEQEKLSKCIDVVGIPDVTVENAREKAKKLFHNALDVVVTDDEIINCSVKQLRTRPNNSSSNGNMNSNEDETEASASTNNAKSTSISIELVSPALKKAIMLSKKTHFKKLSGTLFEQNNKQKIYVNESLSSYFRALYAAAKNIKKREKLKFLWFSNSRILLKKGENGKVVIARSFEELNNIKSSDF